MPPALSDRLNTVASLLSPCETIADIGADHAALCVYLLEQGVCQSVLCTDIAEAPLERARENLSARRLSDRAAFLRGDGLNVLAGQTAQQVVIAGLGGDTIRKMLKTDPALVQDRMFVLQPMSKHLSLRLGLSRGGFCIREELLAEDDGRIYPVLLAFYDGIARRAAPLELLCGRQNLLRRDERTSRYLHGILRALTRRRDGRQSAGLDTAPEEKLIARLQDHLHSQENLP